MIIFLDFDGVLHRFGDLIADQLRFLPRFENVLLKYPHAKVVVCSNWRKHHSLAELQAFFADDVRDQVIGVTPDLAHAMGKHDATGIRHREARAWMEENQYRGTWIALDDDPGNWQKDDPLLFCDDGFCEIEEGALCLILNKLTDKTCDC